MTSNNDNSNDQKLGGLRSNGGLDAGEGGNQTYDKGNAYAAASDKVCDTDKKGNECNDGKSGQYSSRGGQENQNQERMAESGSTCGGPREGHVETQRTDGGSNHSGAGQLSSVEENQRTNRETGSTRGGSFEHYGERAESWIKKK